MGNADSQGLASADNPAGSDGPAVVDGKPRRLPDSSAKPYCPPHGATGSDRPVSAPVGSSGHPTPEQGRAFSPDSRYRNLPQPTSPPEAQNGVLHAQLAERDVTQLDGAVGLANAMPRVDRGAQEVAAAATGAASTWGQQQWGVGAPSLMPTAPLNSSPAEVQLRQREAQIQVLSQQIEASQNELQQMRVQGVSSAGAQHPVSLAHVRARAENACQILESVRPEIMAANDKLGKALKVAKKLNAWFVENSKKMNIQDPTATPSAFLEQLLEACEVRSEHLLGHVAKMENGIDVAVARVSATPGVIAVESQGAPSCIQGQVFSSGGGQQPGQGFVPAGMHSAQQSSVHGNASLQGHAGQQHVSGAGSQQVQAAGTATAHAQVAVPRAAPTQVPSSHGGSAPPQPMDSTVSAGGGKKLPMGMWVRDPDAK